MLLFGHRFIQNENFYHILDISAIAKTPPNTTLFVAFDENNLDIINYMQENTLRYATSVTTLTELIYASQLQATYIVVDKELAKSAQNIAEHYLFDAKILVRADDESAIEEFALLGIDGVLFSNAIIKINS